MTMYQFLYGYFLENKYLVIFKNIFQDVRFWILILFFLRLTNITLEPLDEHSWRQSLTITVTENMYYVEANILFPRINIGGSNNGIIAGELPIFNYICYVLSLVFGYHQWYGRIVNLLISSFGLWFFYQIIKRISTNRVAFYSTMFFALSVSFRFARKTMPDTFSISLVLAGVYFAWIYLENSKKYNLIFSFILIAFGLLSKMPAFCVLSFLVVPILDANYKVKDKINLVAATGISVALMLAWYFIWVPHLLKTYHYQLFWAESIREGYQIFQRLSIEAWQKIEEVALGHHYIFIVCVIGLGMTLANNERKILTILGVWSAIFLVFILKTGPIFPTHTYYSIPFTPMMGLTTGYAIANIKIPNLFRIFLAFSLLKMSYSEQIKDFKAPKGNAYLLGLEQIMDRFSNKNDKIMTNTGNFNPTLMYFAHRKGWAEIWENIKHEDWMPDYKKAGLVYILIDKHSGNEPLRYSKIYEDENFILYKP